jgi:hypothetical protein
MHLTPHGFGEMGVDVLNWQPKFKELGRICRQSISRIVRLLALARNDKTTADPIVNHPKADTISVADLTDVKHVVGASPVIGAERHTVARPPRYLTALASEATGLARFGSCGSFSLAAVAPPAG